MDFSKIKQASDMIKNSSKTMVLTGAGISTESGIPDFRSPGSGLWENMDPMEALSTTVLYNNPKKFYSEGYKILLGMTDAKPNTAHYVLAEMEKQGYIKGVITQNIDNLHQKAGTKYLLEVHGNTREGSCTTCGKVVDINVLTEKVNNNEIPPKCNQCGGLLRPDVIFFGDMLPEDFNIALQEMEDCQLLIVIGSSLAVSPVNYLPSMAEKFIIINEGRTAMDYRCDLKIEDKAGVVLEKILMELNKE
ncbi:SIR2 family NAD-dependent protein deacylase [Anaerosalibacter sp. Marseille-P3206]|uniref:SIR2 family NAD-dependent protein deacylase n=1 Tax=Anaerosalibacter sp. Marseille-P3206 TaxID=1871005 RepID=UPI0009844EF3|nr:NAD-dependent protein deacylase [Anaerosalibacter sp. Marseille-P3206]